MQYLSVTPASGKKGRIVKPVSMPATTDNYPIVVHSHLQWDWVWQRPQQFLSRLSKRHPVLFVEGPIPSDVKAPRVTLREVSGYPNIVVLQTHMPQSRWPDGEWIDKERRRIVQSVLAAPLGRKFASPVQWFYDPMAVTAFAGHMNERAIVYDCMDQLSQFRFAPPELVKRERELLAIADVVFAGGPAIWEEKRKHNANCFCFGCGVDAAHFSKASDRRTAIPIDVVNLPGPVYGYIGVVDERLDYELIAALAAADPTGSVVLIGPTTKIDVETLPSHPKLHWLGARDYSLLPAYAKAFDVCLMPFALNKATEFINPTKALEYMATGIPIVSTPVADVVRQFREVITIAAGHRDFIRACHHNAFKPNRAVSRRGRELARENSWEAIVARLENHIDEAITRSSSVAISAA
ncbi:MAG TPA: glycosyltransferase [Chthoniobacterales bacterium]|nr:glycosyltransferase [Chthoniobacterales bacterium]